MGSMMMQAKATDGTTEDTFPVIWSFDETDPLAVTLTFPRTDIEWTVSLDVVRAAMSDPTKVHGSGDVEIAELDGKLIVVLRNNVRHITLAFDADYVDEFLDEVDDSDAEDVIAADLDDFLATL